MILIEWMTWGVSRKYFFVLFPFSLTIKLFQLYPNKERCKETFKQMRLKGGVKCEKCGNAARYWKKKSVINVTIERF